MGKYEHPIEELGGNEGALGGIEKVPPTPLCFDPLSDPFVLFFFECFLPIIQV